jgi:hypothetical protein
VSSRRVVRQSGLGVMSTGVTGQKHKVTGRGRVRLTGKVKGSAYTREGGAVPFVPLPSSLFSPCPPPDLPCRRIRPVHPHPIHPLSHLSPLRAPCPIMRCVSTWERRTCTDLLESDGGGLFPEALSADVHAVLPDESGNVATDSAIPRIRDSKHTRGE